MKTIQSSTASFSTRHDDLFQDLADALSRRGADRPKILSFGCSEGFEPLDLQRLVPVAEIFGCDVNQRVLAKAHERCDPAGITIFESDAGAIARHGPYDAIVCMNVLVRYPEIQGHDDITGIYPFAEFEETAGALLEQLAPGGFFVLFNSCYLMEDMATTADLSPVAPARHRRNGWIEKYDRTGRRLTQSFGEIDGQWLPVVEWRRAIQIAGKGMTDRTPFKTLPYRHDRVEGIAADFDDETSIWMKAPARRERAGARPDNS